MSCRFLDYAKVPYSMIIWIAGRLYLALIQTSYVVKNPFFNGGNISVIFLMG